MSISEKQPLPPVVEDHLVLCARTYERMVENGEWLWRNMSDFD